MYVYDDDDYRLVMERARQFRGQVERRIRGELPEDEFRPLRLQNGLYMQLHAYMLRIAVPYGLLSSRQVRQLAHIADTYDRGYLHFTTRQNVQLNWPTLESVPAILDCLAEVGMHAIQTSGNCVRNITSDPFAGVAADEVIDPRPYCELLRQWSTFHPEFTFLPRKFKIAVTGAPTDRAALLVHDVGLRVLCDASGAVGFECFVGGGQGRTPVLAERTRAFLPEREILAYLEAVLRVYNELGRRDRNDKARIKILVKEMGAAAFTKLIDDEFAITRADPALEVRPEDVARFTKHFIAPTRPPSTASREALLLDRDRSLARWVEANVLPHRERGYSIVQLSLKSAKLPPGDLTSDQLRAVADLADRYSFGRVVATHRQNLVLPDVASSDLRRLHASLVELDLATPNVGRVSDVVCCPGLDYCDLANARSIPVAQRIAERFADANRTFELGPLTVNISGCINACGHHHVGHIGVLGIDKQGEEFYQLTVGGDASETAAIGAILGKAFSSDEIVPALERLLDRYVELRASPSEAFLATLRRVGTAAFKEALYGTAPA